MSTRQAKVKAVEEAIDAYLYEHDLPSQNAGAIAEVAVEAVQHAAPDEITVSRKMLRNFVVHHITTVDSEIGWTRSGDDPSLLEEYKLYFTQFGLPLEET